MFLDTAFGFELAITAQQRSSDRRAEVFRNQDKNPFKSDEFQSSLGGTFHTLHIKYLTQIHEDGGGIPFSDLMRIDQKYHSLKSALKNQMGGYDRGLSLTQEGTMTHILEISET